ncbi:UDP-GlcNAc:betaGal beta-1,3-N-acetylglucosaminyltransferase 7, like [Polypterus senegalus]
MEPFLRRKRVFKTLLSLAVAFGTLVMIPKYADLEKRVKQGLTLRSPEWRWPESALVNGVPTVKTGKSKNVSFQEPPEEGPFEAAGYNGAPVDWDVRGVDCSPNPAVMQMNWFLKLDQHFQRFVLYRHCKYYPMLINHPEKCKGDIHLLMVIKSVIEHHDRREAVRQTWGKERNIGDKKIKTLFLLGTPSLDNDAKNLQKLIEFEDRLYGDILQWDFLDTFFNLTLKEVNFLKWFHIYCPRTQFIFKGDDDVFVNPDNLLELLSFRRDSPGMRSLFVGDTIHRAIPIRNRKSKYFIPRELYDKPYPPYVGGGGFLMSGALAQRLFIACADTVLYPIDDVFLGMCLQKVKVTPENHPGFRTFGIMKHKVSPMNNDPCFYKHLLVIHKLNPQELLHMWNSIHDANLICAKKSVLL